MNYIKHLTGFFTRIAIEETIYPTHISLYLALFQSWNVNRFKNPIAISRDEMMKASRIASKATYHKCIKELQELGFIDYLPSYNPYSGTEVIIHNLSDGNWFKKTITSSSNSATKSINEQAIVMVAEQVNEPHIYNNKQTYKNNKNISIDTNFQILNDEDFLSTSEKEKKSSAKRKENPNLELVKEYFNFKRNTEFEAERFFNYYTSNGWLIGGKTKMIDWKASARNWILNTSKFAINLPQSNPIKEQSRANNLQTNEDKDYAEPL
ncbi:transcriptional regulator [Flavobacterium geliluteum]|uniref:Transcriptional regulator n=1 Tax=Flavobacterium geliluteum TaxID=2816120 RepID=A0A940XB23_9FLAO|nr:transcriptional regulator [Flavobacterium geliluteum]MBP4139187.1 transcriptional regulator [Flavobacterium geliluteum]